MLIGYYSFLMSRPLQRTEVKHGRMTLVYQLGTPAAKRNKGRHVQALQDGACVGEFITYQRTVYDKGVLRSVMHRESWVEGETTPDNPNRQRGFSEWKRALLRWEIVVRKL